jgi:hypothetical protein
MKPRKPQTVPSVLQRKPLPTRLTAPVAVSRPPVGPAKIAAGRQSPIARGLPPAKPVRAPMSVPKVLQAKKNGPGPPKPAVTQAKPPAAAKNTTVQRTTSRVVQAVKFFPNLHPGAVEPINQGHIFRLNSFAGQYRLHQVHNHGVNVPNQQYNFVRTREGEMLLHNRYRHPSIAEGKQVLYAGEVFFNNGSLEWWSNGSGHYQPGADDAEQASLPMDRFFSYQQIIKGEHTRKKGKS